MNIYEMSEEGIERNFIHNNKVIYGGILETALIECIKERMGFCDDWNQVADTLDTLESLAREFGYIDTEVSKVYEKLNNKNIKK